MRGTNKMKAYDTSHKSEQFENKQYSNQSFKKKSKKIDYNIWDLRSPAFSDENEDISTIKTVFIIGFGIFFMIATFLISNNLYISLGLFLFTLIFLTIAFHDSFFHLDSIISNKFRKFTYFNPFEDIVFWRNIQDSKSLYCSNKKDLVNIGLRIFKIEVIPANVHAALNQFIMTMRKYNINYTYQIAQTPVMDISKKDMKRQEKKKSIKSFKTDIYFSIFFSVPGILNQSKLSSLNYSLREATKNIRANFVANFHHFKIDLLRDNELVNALRIFITKSDHDYTPNNHMEVISKENLNEVLLKLICIIFLMSYTGYLLAQLGFILSFILLVETCIVITSIFIWWRELLF